MALRERLRAGFKTHHLDLTKIPELVEMAGMLGLADDEIIQDQCARHGIVYAKEEWEVPKPAPVVQSNSVAASQPGWQQQQQQGYGWPPTGPATDIAQSVAQDWEQRTLSDQDVVQLIESQVDPKRVFVCGCIITRSRGSCGDISTEEDPQLSQQCLSVLLTDEVHRAIDQHAVTVFIVNASSHPDGMHWSTATYHPMSNTIYVCDSSMGSAVGRSNRRLVRCLEDVLTARFLLPVHKVEDMILEQQQAGELNCGKRSANATVRLCCKLLGQPMPRPPAPAPAPVAAASTGYSAYNTGTGATYNTPQTYHTGTYNTATPQSYHTGPTSYTTHMPPARTPGELEEVD